MTLQEIFNKVYLGLASQGFKQSADDNGRCVYRSSDGCKCAAGQLIPDEDYRKEFDVSGPDIGTMLYTSVGYFKNEVTEYFRRRFDLEQIYFIRQLQLLHDGCDGSSTKLRKSMEDFATIKDLEIPTIP